MMRPLLAVMAGLLCGAAGLRQAQRLRENCLRLAAWENVLRRLALIMEESTLSLPDAFEQAADMPGHPLRRLAEAMRASPLQPLPTLLDGVSIEGAEAPPLSRMTSHIAHGSLDSRVLAVRQAAEEIALLAGSAREKAAQDARMWTTLGFAAGACLTLMLL